jgi:hypothetical protein
MYPLHLSATTNAKSIYQQTFEKDSSFTLLRAINVEKATNAALDEQMSLE